MVNEPIPIWRTWKLYVGIAVLVLVGMWVWNTQSPVAQLKDGTYKCMAVFVNQAKRYASYVDDEGNLYTGYARVERGQVIDYSAPAALGWQDMDNITIRKSGKSHFHLKQDPTSDSYDALACDWAGQ